jgi:hypothetical protein
VIEVPEQFANALGAAKKRALYYVEIPLYNKIITSFIPIDAGVSTGNGWGVMLWGVDPWGS